MTDIRVAISTVSDGNMLIPDDRSNRDVAGNRAAFLKTLGIAMEQSSRVNVTYDTPSFRRYHEVSLVDFGGAGMRDDDSMPADALITTDSNHALFLPLADCVGTVLYDPVCHVLMLSHLGRHSVEQFGGQASVEYLVQTHGCDPANIRVWLTPAPGKEKYPMWAFDNKSIKEVVITQLESAGILAAHITDNPIDTTTDENFFSHSEFLAGNRSVDGRYSIIAMMSD